MSALDLETKAISGLRRDASVGRRLGGRVASEAAA